MTTSSERWRLGRRPALDGLRGVAILLVLAGHVLGVGNNNPGRYAALGSCGVTVFFVLSGFLITCVLLEGHALGSRLTGFYRRRVLRLAPALLVLIAVLWGAEAWSGADLAPLRPVLLYYANWMQAGGDRMGVMGHAWSLSIEEQFYFIWPVILLLSMRWRRAPVVITAVGIAGSTALRFWLAGGIHASSRSYYGTDAQAASLLVGCLLALLAYSGLRLVRTSPWVITTGAFALGAMIFAHGLDVADIVVPTMVPWIAATLIWGSCSMPGGWLSGRVLRYFGSRSYGLYLWHYPLLAVAAAGGWSAWRVLIALAATAGVAEFSWRLVEQPAMRLASRSAKRGPGLVSDTGIVAATP